MAILVVDEVTDLVTVTDETSQVFEVITEGPQGPPGPQGPAGGGGGSAASFEATHNVIPSSLTPVFTKVPENPIFEPADAWTGALTIFWPSIINMAAIDATASLSFTPFDNYYMFYSTDHETTAGIYLATAPTPIGPWTQRGNQPRWRDTRSGITSTETPCILYVPEDPDGKPFYLYYHVADTNYSGGLQHSCVVKTADPGQQYNAAGAWSAPANILSGTYERAGFDGNDHTGYMMPFRIGKMFGAFSVFGGGDLSSQGLHWSPNGWNWAPDARLLRGELHYSSAQTRRQTWRTWFWWKSKPYALGVEQGFDASGTVPKNAVQFIAPLSQDLRKMAGKPTYILDTNLQAWETNDIRAQLPFVDTDGKLYIYYQCSQAFGVAVAE